MCAGVSKQELSSRRINASERSMGSRDCCAVGVGHLDKCGSAVIDYETEKRNSKVNLIIFDSLICYF